jgi:hypothetical protein
VKPAATDERHAENRGQDDKTRNDQNAADQRGRNDGCDRGQDQAEDNKSGGEIVVQPRGNIKVVRTKVGQSEDAIS